jgi:hypothetical protein
MGAVAGRGDVRRAVGVPGARHGLAFTVAGVVLMLEGEYEFTVPSSPLAFV